MNHHQYTLITPDGRNLFAASWIPELETKAVVTLVHGFGEHCLRYAPYIDYFMQKGIAFLGFDLQGHGQSDGKKGVIVSYDSILDDIELALKKAGELFPGVPQFLYGHSMGGNLALNFLLRRQSDLKCGIITSPWLALTKEPPTFLKKTVALLEPVIPNLTIDSGLDVKYISTVEEEVAKYKADPLNHGRISFRLFHEITKSGMWAVEHTSNLKIPILLMHGLADQITSPKVSEQAFHKNEALIDWKTWDGRYHELHNESNRVEVAATVIDWIQIHLK